MSEQIADEPPQWIKDYAESGAPLLALHDPYRPAAAIWRAKHRAACVAQVGCGCACHRWPGVKHFVACCEAPPFTEPEPTTAWWYDPAREWVTSSQGWGLVRWSWPAVSMGWWVP